MRARKRNKYTAYYQVCDKEGGIIIGSAGLPCSVGVIVIGENEPPEIFRKLSKVFENKGTKTMPFEDRRMFLGDLEKVVRAKFKCPDKNHRISFDVRIFNGSERYRFGTF